VKGEKIEWMVDKSKECEKNEARKST